MAKATPPKPSGKSAPTTSDYFTSLTRPIRYPDRHLTVGLVPEPHPKTPWIRLRGQWLSDAGFTPNTRIRVQVGRG